MTKQEPEKTHEPKPLVACDRCGVMTANPVSSISVVLGVYCEQKFCSDCASKAESALSKVSASKT